MVLFIRIFAAVLLAISVIGASVAGAEVRKPEVYTDFQGVAIRGYDTVAYFTENRAVKGTPAHAFEWNGAVWHFTSAEHRDLFAADPEKYAPEFGGYCAWGVYKDKVVNSNPEVFDIVDGRLYLNLSDKVQEKWRAQGGVIAAAKAHWPKVLILAE